MNSKLRAFINALPDDHVRRRFAARCETILGHLKNVMYGLRPCAPDLAVSIERESGWSVTRRDLRDDWHRFWPELIDTPDPAGGAFGPNEGAACAANSPAALPGDAIAVA